MKKVLILLVIILTICGCTKKEIKEKNKEKAEKKTRSSRKYL